jgi:hypothetical protein
MFHTPPNYGLSAKSDVPDKMAHRDVQGVRIALLAHHTSQMQAYKTYILTLVGSLLGVTALLLQLKSTPSISISPDTMKVVFVALGFITGTIFYSIARFAWYGQIVTATIFAPLGKRLRADSFWPEAKTLMGKVDDYINHYAGTDIDAKAERDARMRVWRWLFYLGVDQVRLFLFSGVIWLAITTVLVSAYQSSWSILGPVLVFVVIALAALTETRHHRRAGSIA